MQKDNKVFDLIRLEEKRQLEGLELIASENFVSPQILEANGSVLTNKYAEGYPNKRYYAGCEVVDQIEQLAIDRAKILFGAEWVNVQPHSGSQANTAVYHTFLKPGDSFLGFDLSHGGHLTHGATVNFSGKLYKPYFYGVDRDSGLLDYDSINIMAQKIKPKMIIAGASAYSRDIDYKRFRAIADGVGAILWADIAHPCGLIVKGLLNDPVPHCHVITTTTHKTLRGSRGGMIILGKDFENPRGIKTPKGKIKMVSNMLDSAVFPGIQGGPLEHIIAAKAITYQEALQDGFYDYALQVKKNANTLGRQFKDRGYHIISGGTENHMILLDLRNKNITGKLANDTLEKSGITVNKNMVPFDDKSPFITSGIRIGTSAITTRGMKENDMETIAGYIDEVLLNIDDDKKQRGIAEKVRTLVSEFPLFAW